MSTKALTTGEIAEYCGVNFRTVIRWIERGELIAYKLPGRGDNRVTMEEFMSFLKAHGIPIPKQLLAKPRILVVDDDKSMAKSIGRVLKKIDCELEFANDGFYAGVQLQKFQPTLMTLDLSMPGIDGYGVLDYITNYYKHPIKILVVSALDDAALEEAKERGADEVLSKPFDNKTLLQTVQLLAERI